MNSPPNNPTYYGSTNPLEPIAGLSLIPSVNPGLVFPNKSTVDCGGVGQGQEQLAHGVLGEVCQLSVNFRLLCSLVDSHMFFRVVRPAIQCLV